MALTITRLLKEGTTRSITRNGLILMGILFVLSAFSSLLGAGLVQYTPNQQFVQVDAPATAVVSLPPLLAGLLSLIIGLATLIVSIAAIRVFVSDETEQLPREYFTQHMGWTVVNFIVGGIVFGIIIGLGLIALIIPGLFLLVTLTFWSVYVAVEDQNFIEGFSSSWGLTRGHRLKLFLLGIAVVFVVVVITAVFGAAGGTIGGLVLAALASAITTIFSTAVLAAAYTELTALAADDGTLSAEEDTIPPTDAEHI